MAGFSARELYNPSSSIKTGKDTLDIAPEDFFDRIINLRILLWHDDGNVKSFTIRSDYEVEYLKNGSFQYTHCRQKPDIKVSYKQLAAQTAISLDIEVSNLFVEDMDLTKFNNVKTVLDGAGNAVKSTFTGQEEVYNDTSNPFGMVVIQMGYRAQFPDWTQQPWASVPVQDFLQLKTDGDLQGLTLKGQLLAIYQTKGPPDKTTKFQCVIGTAETGLLYHYTEEDLDVDLTVKAEGGYGDKPPRNQLAKLFYESVTKRFVRSNIEHRTETEYARPVDSAAGSQAASSRVKGQKVIIYEGGEIKETLHLSASMLMTDEQAEKYGTTVAMSQTLWDANEEELPSWGATAEQAAKRKPMTQPLQLRLQKKLTAQLREIQKQFPFVRYFALSDGNLFAYHVKETITDLFRDPYINDRQKKGIIKLPAVYDIQLSGTQIVRCPFCSIISPGQTVAFQSDFAVGDMVSYFYKPEPGHDLFLVLYSTIDFATVQNSNVMTLTCAMIKGASTPKTLPDGSIAPAVLPATTQQQERNRIWFKAGLTVEARYTGKDSTTNASWHDIAARLKDDTRTGGVDVSERWGAGRPTTEDAMNALVEWNGELFSDDRLDFANSVESGTPGVAGIRVPVLYHKSYNPVNPGESDVVNVRRPFLPEYLTEEEIV
jgi:hypothetical protein